MQVVPGLQVVVDGARFTLCSGFAVPHNAEKRINWNPTMAQLLRCRFCVLAMESVAISGGGAVLVCMECAPAEGHLAVAPRGAAWHGIASRGAVMMSRKRAEVRRGSGANGKHAGAQARLV
jgi:hypothetical protein